MNWLIDNWTLLVAGGAVLAVVVVTVILFFKKSYSEQFNNLKEWLLYAVMEAEKQLGEKMGQAKLRMVYDMAVQRFGWIAKILPFETFSKWVDEALDVFRNMLDSNEKMEEYVKLSK